MANPVPRLAEVRQVLDRFVEDRVDRDGPFGAYRHRPGQRTDLYSALDIAIMRTIMGEDLRQTLSDAQRADWCAHINSFASGRGGAMQGTYEDTHGHSPLHANGMAIGALGALGWQQRAPVPLYAAFDAPETIGRWLETVDWRRAWSQSHAVWGGPLCFSFAKSCPPGWLDAAFRWLDAEIDPKTGLWRRGTDCADRHQPLGGLVHILPLYQHHGHAYPFPDRAIDSILALQLDNGRWLDARTPDQTCFGIMHYLELDALYALRIMSELAPDHRRADIMAALDRYIALVSASWPTMQLAIHDQHPHVALAMAGTFGCLQQLRPDNFPDNCAWTDIFGDRRFYRTDVVEAKQ